jgi:hypothetical protein
MFSGLYDNKPSSDERQEGKTETPLQKCRGVVRPSCQTIGNFPFHHRSCLRVDFFVLFRSVVFFLHCFGLVAFGKSL